MFGSSVELSKVTGSEIFYPIVGGSTPADMKLSNRGTEGTQRVMRRASTVTKGIRNSVISITHTDSTGLAPVSSVVQITLRVPSDKQDVAVLTDLLTEIKSLLSLSGAIAAFANDEA